MNMMKTVIQNVAASFLEADETRAEYVDHPGCVPSVISVRKVVPEKVGDPSGHKERNRFISWLFDRPVFSQKFLTVAEAMAIVAAESYLAEAYQEFLNG